MFRVDSDLTARARTMRISGFSFARNAHTLGYPLREALLSLLPLVDELVVALAPGGPGDDTRGVVESLDDPRVRIVEGVWDENRRQKAYADLTNVALDACTGDWCVYVQADEAYHEDDLPILRERMEALHGDRRVQGLLFKYLHFFGDYRHLQTGQGWYQREIRVVRNGIGARSVRDAQSFRFADERRLTVAWSGARIFHYGWVRHPRNMQVKVREFWSHRGGKEIAERRFGAGPEFDYGPLGRLEVYEGSHPAVMRERMAAMDWADTLREVDSPGMQREILHKDERFKYRFLTGLGRMLGVDLNHTNHGRILKV